MEKVHLFNRKFKKIGRKDCWINGWELRNLGDKYFKTLLNSRKFILRDININLKHKKCSYNVDFLLILYYYFNIKVIFNKNFYEGIYK